jgi:tRNA 2-thiouridine synthesizing protein A
VRVSDAVFDAKGLNCPVPTLTAEVVLQSGPAGGLLEIHATDPGAVKDFQAFCRSTESERVASSQEGSVFKFVIERVK